MSSRWTNLRWYALYVKAHSERIVASQLREYGQESFLPTYKIGAAGAHYPAREAPLFPGYVFCRLDWETGPKLYRIPGIIRVVGIGKTPVPIEDDEIGAIRRVTENSSEPEPCPFGVAGTPVRVVKGPLEGIEGIVAKRLAGAIVISVSLLKRSVAVKMDPECLVIVTGDARGEETPAALPSVGEEALMEYAVG
jgi:transcription antitermination factor NusG